LAAKGGLWKIPGYVIQRVGDVIKGIEWVGKKIGEVVGRVFKGLYNGLPQGIRKFLGGVKNTISRAWKGLKEKVGISDVDWYSHISAKSEEFSLTNRLLTSILDTAVYIGSYKALKAMGLNNTWTNLLSGAILGGFTGFDKSITFEQGLIQGLALAGMSEADLDGWEYILGVALASGLGAIFDDDNAKYYRYENGERKKITGKDTNFFNSFFDEKVIGEILYRGIQKLGEALGLDPIYTMTTGLGIRSAFYHDPKLAALQAGVNIAIGTIIEAITGKPWEALSVETRLLAAMTADIVTGLLYAAYFGYKGRGYYDGERKGAEDEYLKEGSENVIAGFLLDPFTYGTTTQPISDLFGLNSCLSDVMRFGEAVDEQGFGKAFGSHTADIWINLAVLNTVDIIHMIPLRAPDIRKDEYLFKNGIPVDPITGERKWLVKDEKIEAIKDTDTSAATKEEVEQPSQKPWYSPIVDAFKAIGSVVKSAGSLILGIATGLIDTLLLPLNIVLDIANIIDEPLDVSGILPDEIKFSCYSLKITL